MKNNTARKTLTACLVLLMSAGVITTLVVTAAPQKDKCDALMAAVARAQDAYNRARAARVGAERDLNRARNQVTSIVAKIKANEAQQSKAEAALDKLKEEQARCENTNGDLSPLSGNCATVQTRIDRAKKDIAALRATHDQLMDQRQAADMDVERTERDLAAKQAAESAAQAALEQAKRDAAGCRRTA